MVTLRGTTGWREVEIGRGSSDATCPVVALQTWLKFARIAHGPMFRRVTGRGKTTGANRFNDREGRSLGQTDRAGGRCAAIWPRASAESCLPDTHCDLAWPPRPRSTSAMSKNSLGHASAEMSRKYQRRRDRFRVNLTKASGLLRPCTCQLRSQHGGPGGRTLCLSRLNRKRDERDNTCCGRGVARMEAPPCPLSNCDKHLCLRISKNSAFVGAVKQSCDV